MYKRKNDKSEIIVRLIGLAIIIALIAIISKFITNRKEATYVSTNEADASLNVEATNKDNIAANTENSIATENTSSENNSVAENTSTENNIIIENNTVTEINAVEENNTTSQNTTVVEENNTTSQNTINQTKTTSINKDRKGVIYLTFDDGPSSTSTPKILDILKEENVKATFFILNYSKANEKYVKREVEEGHTIGIHGYSHEYSKIYKSKEAYFNNIYSLQKKIKESTGVTTMYTRFPGGSSNTVSRHYSKGIMKALTKEMLAKGFKYYDWNISSGDAGGAKSSKDVYKNVTKNLNKKKQNMVLMHDFSNNKKTIGALKDVIKYAKKKGFTFMPVDDETPLFAQHVNN